MENPILENGRRYPPHPFFSFGDGVSAHPSNPDPETRRAGPPARNKGAEVVRIPAHFIGSVEPDRSGSALKVQKVFRGFVVRKWLKKIRDIETQVDGVEESLSRGEVMELVRRDSREQLRINEDLMSLLFKLDSIKGVDFGVRARRKAVIRKAIALQERIDTVVACGDDREVVSNPMPENDDGEVEIIDVGVDREVKVVTEEDSDSRRNREMLERIMEDNEKMMRLMTQFLERNESQSRMISSLVDRVEMLEKAFVCGGRLRNKKTKKKKNKIKKGVSSCKDDS